MKGGRKAKIWQKACRTRESFAFLTLQKYGNKSKKDCGKITVA